MKMHQLLVGLSQPEGIIHSTNICSVVTGCLLCQLAEKKNRLGRKFCPESPIKWITQNCLYGWTCLQTHLAKQRLFNFLSKIQQYTHDQVLAWSPGYFFFPVNQRNTFINLLKLSRHSSETWHSIWLSFPNSKCKLQKEEWVFAFEPPDGNTAQ